LKYRLGFAAAIASVLGVCGAAFAQTTPTAPSACETIASDPDRLACYDRRSLGAATPLAPAPGDDARKGMLPALFERGTTSLIDAAWGFNADSARYIIDVHNPNYLLFARYTDNVNTAPFSPAVQASGQQDAIDSTEAKFQISFKMRLWTTGDRRWGLWGAYTQQNQWQVYNSDISRPFRETNYMPEAFVSYRPGIDVGGFHWRLLNVGFNHQSNGRTDQLSRSWNRIVADAGVERDNFAVLAKVWYRIKESADKDDNPDITDYYGYGSLTAIYKRHDHSFSLMGRGNVSTGKGAAQLTWMSPRFLGPLRWYVQGFSGYGESMIDYNWNQKTIGFGVAINDAL